LAHSSAVKNAMAARIRSQTWSKLRGRAAAEEGFEFCEQLLDRIEVGTVGRQEAHARADGFDRVAYLWLLIYGKVVEHDYIARAQRRHQDLLHVGADGGCVERSIEDRGRCQSVKAQARDDRVRLPMTARRVIMQPSPAGTATVAPLQIGGDATFIEYDIRAEVVQRLGLSPAATLSRDVGPAVRRRVPFT
jgi:hypothetical protein